MTEIVSHWKDFHEIVILEYFFRKYVQKTQVSLKPHKYNGTSHEDRYTVSITSRSVLRIMQNISDKFVEKLKTTHFIFSELLSAVK